MLDLFELLAAPVVAPLSKLGNGRYPCSRGLGELASVYIDPGELIGGLLCVRLELCLGGNALQLFEMIGVIWERDPLGVRE